MGENRTFLLPVSLFWLSQFWFGRGEVEFSGDRDEERDPEDPCLGYTKICVILRYIPVGMSAWNMKSRGQTATGLFRTKLQILDT